MNHQEGRMRISRLIVAAALSLAGSAAVAQSYPDRPVRIVVGILPAPDAMGNQVEREIARWNALVDSRKLERQ
jgi:tripartite-type tricarboxylate transporter receptor subunit TctC